MKNCVQIFKFESTITEIFNLEYWNFALCTIRKLAFCMGIHKFQKNFFFEICIFLKNPKTRVRLFCVYNKNLQENRRKNFHACSPFVTRTGFEPAAFSKPERRPTTWAKQVWNYTEANIEVRWSGNRGRFT
jgi:hypothetical protein